MLTKYIKTLKRYVKIILRILGKWIPQLPNRLIVKRFRCSDSHIFFGYYDITPFSRDNSKVLACSVPLDNDYNNLQYTMQVGYYNINEPKTAFNIIGETNAWCWQMGPRLRWFDDKKDLIAYNSVDNNSYSCIIQDINTKDIHYEIPIALYDINNTQSFGISLNFSRLQRLRPGYGYKILPDNTVDDLAPKDDGIFLYNFNSNEVKLLVTLSEVSNIQPDASMSGAQHYFNHVSFSPYSDNFTFFHLWEINGKTISKYKNQCTSI